MWEGANVFFHVLILKEIIKKGYHILIKDNIYHMHTYVQTHFFSGYVERKIIREKKERDGKNGTHNTHKNKN